MNRSQYKFELLRLILIFQKYIVLIRSNFEVMKKKLQFDILLRFFSSK